MAILFEKKLLDSLQKFRDKKIVVAFSGGADSTALLYFLQKNRFNIIASHINHSIRGENADRDENFCREFCKKYNIELVVKKVDAPSCAKAAGFSIEEAARKLRYEKLFEVFSERDCDYIFTAHHIDDLVETFFIKVFQGAAIYNLKGFDFNKNILIRPLLEIEKSEILGFLKSHNVEYMEDETNFCADYLRNFVRLYIVPQIKSYNKKFIQNILKLQEESEELKNYLFQKLYPYGFKENRNFMSLSRKYFDSLPNFEKRFILSELFKNFFRVEKRHIDLCLKIVNESKHSNRIILPKDYIFEKSYDNLYFFKKDLIRSFQVYKEVGVSSLEIEKLGKKIAFLNHMADKNLLVRNRKKGDRIKGKKLKDIFIDKKIDLFIRDTAIVVEENGEIVFVEGVLEDKDIKISWSEYGAK